MKRKIVIAASVIVVMSLLLTVCGCGRSSSADASNTVTKSTIKETKQQVTKEPATEAETTTAAKTEFAIGEPWTVDGQWSLTVTGVTETEERNQYSDYEPAAVYIVDYTYENLGYESSFWDGLYLSIDDTIVDSAGKLGYSYPGSVTFYPKETPVGATCQAQVCIGVDNAGTFKLQVKQYDGNDKAQKATFVLDPAAESVEYIPVGSSSASSSDSILKIGDTWTVDSQWTMTITGVSETADRNQFSDYTPAAVYIVNYTYTNLGYESDFMDGLYLTVDDTIVDFAGKLGYSYPNDITYYPQETPVGATCEAQACIGVDNAGNFKLIVSHYDGNDKKQSQTFLVEVN